MFNARSVLGSILTLLLISTLGGFGFMATKLNKLNKQNKSYKQILALLNKPYTFVPPNASSSMPTCLRNVPYGEHDGIVLSVRKVSIRGVAAPYNASIIEHNEGYLLVFRYDEFHMDSPYGYYARVGCVELDRDFKQTEKEFVTINLPGEEGEDPRVFKANGNLYLVYNAGSLPHYKIRRMHIAELDSATYKIKFATCLDLRRNMVEKNWSPFEYIDDSEQSHINFVYSLNPYVVLNLDDPTSINNLRFLDTAFKVTYRNIPWPENWGVLRGGSSARKIGNEYLSFFHSAFVSTDDSRWYVFGAYTFKDTPPFTVTSLSHYPILFDGIYTAPPLNTANPGLRCIYPGGFVVEHKDGRDLIHLACGENDSCVKIITMDKEALLKNMKKLF